MLDGGESICADARPRRLQRKTSEVMSTLDLPHIKALYWMRRGHLLADTSAIIGSLHIVFGEIDR